MRLSLPHWADRLLERRCAACLEPFAPRKGGACARLLCPECALLIKERNAGYCPYCGEIFAFEDAPCTPCGACMEKLPPWSEFLFCGVHDGLLRDLILTAKFGGSLQLLHFLGVLLADACGRHYAFAPKPEAIVPMPLYPADLTRRGYSQCREICRPVEKSLGVAVRYDLLEKIMPTPEQARLSREERKKMKQVFRGDSSAGGMHVLLVEISLGFGYNFKSQLAA